MRVLMAPVNIAGQPITVTTELRKQGVDVSLLQFTAGEGHAYGYPSDQLVNIKGRHRVEAQTETLEATLAAGYDIFHFWMSTFFGGRRYANMYGLDLPFIKARGRRIIYRGTGFDLRLKSQHIARNPHHPFQHGYVLDIDEDAQRRYIEYLKTYVDLFIVQDPEMQEFMPHARVVPRAINVDDFKPVGIEPNDRPLIVHAPSKSLVKGTSILTRVLEELEAEGLSFELKVITGIPHSEAMAWYRKADLVVDQLLLGWYGVLTVEALALGKPVVVYVRDDLYGSFMPQIPVANANPTTLKDVLRPLLSDFKCRQAVAQHGPEFVQQVHDVRKIAGKLRDIYAEVLDMPVGQPEGYADLRHFLAQFKEVEALEERRKLRFQSAKYGELLEELPRLRFRAKQYEELMDEVKALRRMVREHESDVVRGREVELSDDYGENDVDPATIDQGELRYLRKSARAYDQLAEELPRLRYKAKRAEELTEELKGLRYKAGRYDALCDEVHSLRLRLGRYEKVAPDTSSPTPPQERRR